MSSFDDWWGNQFGLLSCHPRTIAYHAWNAALDALADLANVWEAEHSKGFTNREMQDCVDQLRNRIKQLRAG